MKARIFPSNSLHRFNKKQAADSAACLLVGTPDAIRTHDLSLRRRTLYPAELRGRVDIYMTIFKTPGTIARASKLF
jgi:hypothetical protein